MQGLASSLCPMRMTLEPCRADVPNAPRWYGEHLEPLFSIHNQLRCNGAVRCKVENLLSQVVGLCVS